MPFTRISLLAGKSPSYLANVAASLDRALTLYFEVPLNDRFVAIHQHQVGELIFDRHYNGGARSDDYILFHITTGRTRSSATKVNFYKCLADDLSATVGIRPEDVMVVVADSTLEDWSFGSGICAAKSAGATK